MCSNVGLNFRLWFLWEKWRMTTVFGGLCERARLLSFGFVTVAETLEGKEREKGKCANIGIFPFYRPDWMGKSHQFFNFPSAWNTRNATGIGEEREGRPEGPFQKRRFCINKERSFVLSNFKLRNIYYFKTNNKTAKWSNDSCFNKLWTIEFCRSIFNQTFCHWIVP